jgi:16S rRNA methyltransferase RsmB/F
MVVHIYSLSQWKVVLSSELKEYYVSCDDTAASLLSSSSSSSLPDFFHHWLTHSIKISPSTTICRFNYCSDRFNNHVSDVVERKKVETSIKDDISKSIHKWLRRRKRSATPSTSSDEQDDSNGSTSNEDYTVIVESHAILEDVVSIQILNSTTQESNTLYTSTLPPPLITWYQYNQGVVRDASKVKNDYATVCGTNPTQHQQQQQQHNWRKEQKWPPYPYGVVIVDRICGEAILRGADIYPTNGILCTDTYVTTHSPVAVYVDMTSSDAILTNGDGVSTRRMKKFSRGVTLQEFSTNDQNPRSVVLIGIGIATCPRSDIFTKNSSYIRLTTTAAAIRMIQIATPSVSYLLPPINEILSHLDDTLVVQNLPSLLVAHTLLDDEISPVPTSHETHAPLTTSILQEEWILDMCCAPGGKTSHIASLLLVKDQSNSTVMKRKLGGIVACDKSRTKVLQVRDTIRKLRCTTVIPIILDTTKCVSLNPKPLLMCEVCVFIVPRLG